MLWKRSGGVVMVFALIVASACAPRATRPAAGSDVRMVVDNRNWEDATIYIERDGARWKVAMVPALSTRTISVDSRLVNAGRDVRVVAMMRLSRESFHSTPFSAVGARSVELQIGSRLSMSMVSVF